MPNSVVYTGFDPAFGDRLNELIARAKAEGYAPRLISGVRSAYGWPGMKGQSQADLYGQLGQPGGPKAAAPPGYSPHQYGLAGDVTGIPQSELERLAPQVGLRANHSDPNHVELQNWQQAAATQPQMTAWDQTNPANVPSQYAMNMEADAPGAQPGRPVSATPIPGGNDHVAFIQNYAKQIGLDPNLALGIANSEGLRAWGPKNPNAASTVDVQNGQPFSFGDFQLNIHPGAMGAKALAANIDPRDPNQWQAADKFALDQMKTGGVGPWSGDPVAKAYLASGKVPPLAATPGFNINTSAVGGGSATPPAQGGGVLGALTTPGADGKPSPLQQATGAVGKAMDAYGQPDQQQQQPNQQQQLLQQQAAATMGMQHQQQVAAQAQPLMAALMQGAKPLSWGSAPPGSTPGGGAGQAPQINPQAIAAQMMAMGRMIPGTTLNSMGDYGYG